jgi:NAD(P)-dependent dehydrogenase (short-subunit alcohol dehydrogenase family)
MSLNPRITDWRHRRVWLIGASTGIGRATAARLHALGAQVTVSARDAQALAAFVAAHPGSEAEPLDVTDRSAVRDAADRVWSRGASLDLVLYCAGVYQPLRATAFDLDSALRQLQVNYLGALHVLDAVLPALLAQAQRGAPAHLSLVASVAGYRGLPRSLGYGPTKAALINLAETLYLDLAPRGIGVSIVNPGFVATPATAVNDFYMPGLISAEAAAEHMVRGWQDGRFEIHFPRRFTMVLKALRPLADGLYFSAIRRATGL